MSIFDFTKSVLHDAPRRVYLDWAAAAPVSDAARAAFERALSAFGNPSSPHHEGVEAARILETARARIAQLTEVKPDGVIFTSGATEANNLALRGHVMQLRAQSAAGKNIAAKDIHILYAPGMHASVVETLAALAQQEGIAIEALALKVGSLDLDDLAQKLRPETRLVALDGACGETGMKYPTRAVRNALDSFAKEHGTSRILLHVDASQLPLSQPFDLTRLSADMVALDAQKVGGIRGVGALCVRSHARAALAPIMHGGGQEGGLRPGTEPVAAIAAFAAALDDAAGEHEAFAARAATMRTRLIEKLSHSATIRGLLINEGRKGKEGKEDAKEQVPHILNISLPGRDTDYLVMLLDEAGFAVSTKSACETDSEEGSRAVRALTHDAARAQATLRISWGPTTRERDLDRFADALTRAVAFIDEHL